MKILQRWVEKLFKREELREVKRDRDGWESIALSRSAQLVSKNYKIVELERKLFQTSLGSDNA